MTRKAKHIWKCLVLTCLLGLVTGGASLAARANRSELACPSGKTTLLESTAPPGEALLVSFAGRVVGGGVVDGAGQWTIPLVVQARPGVYAVEVVDRSSGQTRAQFTCYVDLSVGATLTPSATVPASVPLSGGATTAVPATATAASPAVLPTDSRPTTATEEADAQSLAAPTATVSVEEPTATPNEPYAPSPTATVMATASPTLEPSPSATPSPTSLPEAPATTLQLAHIEADDPSEEELLEYVVIENAGDTPVDIAGYELRHVQLSQSYLLPNAVLPAQSLLIVYSGAGEDAPEDGVVFWLTGTARWHVGDTAALVSPDGVTVHTLDVAPPEDEPPDEEAASQTQPQETAECSWTQPAYAALFGVRRYLCKEFSQ